MKQTAVEWLVEEMILRLSIRIENTFEGNDLLKKAKEMEKEKIMDSYVNGLIDPLIIKNYKGLSVDEIRIELKKQAAKYYEETYKNEAK